MIGKSVETPVKQEQFRKIIATHLAFVAETMKKYTWAGKTRYQYIDLYAGSGIYPLFGHYIPGSPIIFLQEAAKIGIPYDAYFIEEKKIDIKELRSNVVSQFGSTSSVHYLRGDNREMLPTIQIPNSSFGMIYADPNPGCPQLPLLRRTYRDPAYSTIDLLIYTGFSGMKRPESIKCAKCPLHREPGNLSQCFDKLKQHMAVRLTRGIWDFSFIFGCNNSILSRKIQGWDFLNGRNADEYLRFKCTTAAYRMAHAGRW